MTSKLVSVNGIRLHCPEDGREGRPAVVLLHGFPEFSYSWRNQVPTLVEAGFHVITPDMRGYGLSDKPEGVGEYRIENLVEDVVGLIDSLCGGRAAVVGHDWGGIVAWHLAMWRPEKVSKLVVLNAPHPAAYRRQLLHGKQLLRSWYALAFQLPRVPEAVLRSGGYRMLEDLFREGPARNSERPEEDVRRYLEAIARPGALRSAINYYRAAMRYRSPVVTGRAEVIHVPTMLIWGEEDRYLERELTEGLEKWVSDLRVERLPKASHWAQHDEPGRVNELLVGFLGDSGVERGGGEKRSSSSRG